MKYIWIIMLGIGYVIFTIKAFRDLIEDIGFNSKKSCSSCDHFWNTKETPCDSCHDYSGFVSHKKTTIENVIQGIVDSFEYADFFAVWFVFHIVILFVVSMVWYLWIE